MDAAFRELYRLRRGYARTRSRRALAWGYLLFLGLIAALAVASRILGPWPPFDRLESRWGPTLLFVAALALGYPLLVRLAPLLARAPPRALARRLDDQHAWGDAADTTLSLRHGVEVGPVASFLRAQTAGRLRDLDPGRGTPRAFRTPRRLLFGLLLLLIADALIGFGVTGLAERHGAGRGNAALPGTREETTEAFDADRWLREHARLFLTSPDPEKHPLTLHVRLRTDRALPEDYRTDLVLDWDDLPHPIGPFDVAKGEDVRETDLDLPRVAALEGALTPGRHVARARLVPREGPFEADLPSNDLEVFIEEGGGGGRGAGPPKPEPTPEPPPPEPPPPQPQPRPEGRKAEEPKPPPGPGPTEVVEPLVREDAPTVHKEDAVVAVPDPDAGLAPPPRIPLEDALRDFRRVVERAMADERVGAADREYLRRYFHKLRDLVGGREEDR